MRIAITMPNGKVGSKLVDELIARGGHELTLLTRDGSKLQKAKERGARLREGRLEDVEFVSRATKGIDALFFVLPMDSRSTDVFRDASRITDSVCSAIETNSIPRVVFVSSIGAHLDEGTGPIRYLSEAERKLSEVAPNLTVLRPSFYMDQFMNWMNEIATENRIYSSVAPETSIPMVSARDISRFAAEVLTDARWTGRRNVSLHGPSDYSHKDIAEMMSKTLGLKVEYLQVEPARMADRLRRHGWSETAVSSNLEMLKSLAQGRIVDDTPRGEWNVRPTTFETFLSEDFQPAFDKLAAVGV